MSAKSRNIGNLIKRACLILLALPFIAGIGLSVIRFSRWKTDPTAPLREIHTIAGAPNSVTKARFSDPFGIAVGSDGSVFVTDGDAGTLWLIKRDGNALIIASGLDTPSAVAVAPDKSIVVAETGAHVIRRVYPNDGRTEVVAGRPGHSGFADGASPEALFSGPVGVSVSSDGTVFVADTYNDRIRAIDKNGTVRTIAGGEEPGFADATTGNDARFNTPCGIAVSPDGSLIVADTGNHRIRRLESNGSVRTIAGTGRRHGEDGLMFAASFAEPIGIAVDRDGTIYVADTRNSALRTIGWNGFPRVSTLAGGEIAGFRDGEIESARLDNPTGIALAPDGTILFTDNGNKVVRSIVGKGRDRGARLASDALVTLKPTLSEMRAGVTPRWPYQTADRPREIAATFGEIRGELTDADKEAWFHNGLDIPGAYGETVHAVRSERVLRPLAVEDVGTPRERIRFPLLGYVHLRIGRDANDRVVDESKFLAERDTEGQITGLRVRRGSKFIAGDAIGTLNNQNHVHLTAGFVGSEFNALAALEFPGIKDSVAPLIEDVRLFSADWSEFHPDEMESRITVSGDVRIVAQAYDRMDGNADRRRLGIYRLAYQVFAADGTAALGFTQPVVTILFESLPRDDNAAQLAYASGSRSGATGETVFKYIVTNFVRDREARDAAWSTSRLAPGNYNVKVIAEDFFGNQATHVTEVRLAR